MIGEVRIENYKSIQKLKLELGRVTVLIGENGCGKSNILEAIALASAAADDKLDNEFLASRGIRVTEPQLMRSAFERENLVKNINIDIKGNDGENFSCILHNDNSPYSQWVNKNLVNSPEFFLDNVVPNSAKAEDVILIENQKKTPEELNKITLRKRALAAILELEIEKFNIEEAAKKIILSVEKLSNKLFYNSKLNSQFTLLKTKPYELLKKKDKFNH